MTNRSNSRVNTLTSEFAIPYGYDAARAAFPAYGDDRHLCTIAPTRSGKGATTIVQALLQVPHSVVVIDPKGQNAAITARRRREMNQDVYCLNPQRMHIGVSWKLPQHRYNPLSVLDVESEDLVPNAAALGQAMIVTKGNDPYFDDTARDFVTITALHLVTTLGKRATLAHLRKMHGEIASRDKQATAHIRAMRENPHPFVSQPIGRFGIEDAKDISSALNSSMTQLGFLDWPSMCDPDRGLLTGHDFNFRQLKRKPTTVYIIVPGHHMNSLARLLRIIITQAIEAVISEPGGYPVLFILDEAARLENLEAVSSAYGYAAGFNCQLWPFYQNLKQMEEALGKGWSTVLANSGVVEFFTPSDLDTADYIQRRGGARTGETRSRSYSGAFAPQHSGESRSETQVPLLPHEQSMSLPGDQAIAFFAGTHSPRLVGRKPYWAIPRLKGMYDPDPYHMPGRKSASRR